MQELNPSKLSFPQFDFPSLIEKFGSPHYIKIDIEGADYLCLEGLLEFQVRPQFVSTELEDRHSLLKAIHLLNKLGYRRFKTIDQRLVPKQMPPSPAREGIYLPYHFDLGSSGLFGDELPGEVATAPLLWHNIIFFSREIGAYHGSHGTIYTQPCPILEWWVIPADLRGTP